MVIFIQTKRSKHSIRAVAAAFETHYPGRKYFVWPRDALPHGERVLVLCSFNTPAAAEAYVFAENVRINYPKAVLACGGPHPTARSQEAAKYFDMVCVGEGEYAIKTIVDAYDEGRNAGIIKGERVESLDKFHVFPRMRPQFGPLEITRGCPGRCYYCQTPLLFKGKIRHRSVDALVDDIQFCMDAKKRPMDVRFITSDASFYSYDKGINLVEIERLFLSVRKVVGSESKIFYGSFPSELDPSRVTPELVELMRTHCDNRNAVIGLQSASPAMLDLMNRKSTIGDAERAADILLAAGYEVIVDFIFGLPYETEETLADTLRWIEHWKERVVIHAHPFYAMPGSAWENERPTEVPATMLKLLKSLEGGGYIFGKYV